MKKIITRELEKSWAPYLEEEFNQKYLKELFLFLKKEKDSGKKIYPTEEKIFEALKLTPFSRVKVVILGQDPYHGENEAHGLSFSVKKGVKLPPTLVNIFKELSSDLDLSPPDHGCLESWAHQGVLLLNTVLTVEEGQAGSHQKRGWEHFTDRIIEILSHHKEHLVFILWGEKAQKKVKLIDEKKHLILKSPHPSPLSFYRGFLGSRPFSRANAYLEEHGVQRIDWGL